MWFWWFLFLCDLIVPVLMICAGRVMWKHPPKTINSIYGYRTSRSMKNMDTWKFAHDYCGRLWWKIGWIMLIISVLVQLPFYHATEKTVEIMCVILSTMQCVTLIVSLIPTERALKSHFTNEGLRR